MYWSLSYRFIPYITSIGPFPAVTVPYITSTGPCLTGTSPIQVLVPVLTAHPLNQTTGPYPTDISPMSHELVPVLPVHPLYHKYWSLSYWYILYITSTGPCSNCTSPKSKLLAPVLPIYPICHMYLSLSYRYIPYITSTGLWAYQYIP